jgi:hypothetical protein
MASRFDALHRRGTVTEAMLYAFDLLELDGEDLRSLPLGDRKKRLARLLGGRRLGIVLSDHTDDDGALVFQQACRMGLEGIVSKRLSAPYRSGRSTEWLKIKNPNSPAMIRAQEANRTCGATASGFHPSHHLTVRRFLDGARGGVYMQPNAVDEAFAPYEDTEIVFR